MFGRKKETIREIVECKTCGYLLYKDMAQCVKIQKYEMFGSYHTGDTKEIYLCPTHKVAYDRVTIEPFEAPKYFKDSPTKVNRDGTPCGYVKEVKKEEKKSEPPHNYVDIKIHKAEGRPVEEIEEEPAGKKASRKKMCTRCKTNKILTSFHKSKKGKGGRQPVCKKCVQKYNKEYYLKKKEAYVTSTLN